MEELPPPRNQQSRFDLTGESAITASNTSEASPSASRSTLDTHRLPDTQQYRVDREIDMFSRQNLTQEFHTNNSESACKSCHSCGQTLRIHSTRHSTPVKTSGRPGDFMQNSEQIGSALRDMDAEPFNMNKLKTATEYCQNDGSQWVYSTTTGENKNQSLPPVKEKREKKERKTITSKTFAHGLMDMSLMTSNASQLRSVMSNPAHEFYWLLIYLLILSVILQICSGMVMIVSDFFKSQVKEKDRQNQRKRKTLNFVALAIMMLITSLNVIITAFNTPNRTVYQTIAASTVQQQPMFSSSDYQLHSNHTEL